MKKFISVLLVFMMFTVLFAGCSAGKKDAAVDDTVIRVGGLKGPTSMGMVKLLSDSDNGESKNKYEFTLAGAADEITPLFVKGELDIVSVPVNLASVLYNNTEGKVKVAAVNTLGVIYIVEKGGETVTDIESLKGMTIYATGKGSTPEYSLRYLLEQHRIDPDKDVTIEWKSEPSEIVALMASGENAVAMMPQPYVTAAQAKFDDLRVAIDLTAEWDKIDNGSMLITSCIAVRSEFAEQHPEALDQFIEEFAASAEYVNLNTAEAAALIANYGIAEAAVAEKAIPFCNIVCISGDEMNSALPGYLEILYNANAKSVGGTLPNDDFYYIAK